MGSSTNYTQKSWFSYKDSMSIKHWYAINEHDSLIFFMDKYTMNFKSIYNICNENFLIYDIHEKKITMESPSTF